MPADLPLDFEVLATAGTPSPAASEPLAFLEDTSDVAWGASNQGLQAGLRYKRGLKRPGEFNDEENWQWDGGETASAEYLLRNVTAEPVTFSYVPGTTDDLAVLTPCSHMITPYDDFGPLQRRQCKGGVSRDYEDSGRKVERTLEPGERMVIGRTDFELTELAANRQPGQLPGADRVWVEPAGKYWFATRFEVTARARPALNLVTGRLRLWMRDANRSPAIQYEAPGVVPEDGRLSIHYSIAHADQKAEFVIRPTSGEDRLWVEPVRNGSTSLPVTLPEGEYEVSRRVILRLAEHVHTVPCDRQLVIVRAGETTEASVVRTPQDKAVRHAALPGFSKQHLSSGFVTVHAALSGHWNTDEPTHYFDFLARRTTLCAVECEPDGSFTLEPLPPGRYLVAVRGFRSSSAGQFATRGIALPYYAGCSVVEVRDSLEPSWYPNELKMIERWDAPYWSSQTIGAKASPLGRSGLTAKAR